MRGHVCGTAVLALMLGAAGTVWAQPEGHGESREYNVALGVACDHCHVPVDWRAPDKSTFDFARRMTAMVRGLNDGPLAGRPPITCWSCHRGQRLPARLPQAAWKALLSEYAPVFASGDADQALTMSVYASSLGVRCSYCHVQGAWADPSRPPHATTRTMVSMFDLIPSFFDAAVRTPTTQCFMCHHGRPVVERARPVQLAWPSMRDERGWRPSADVRRHPTDVHSAGTAWFARPHRPDQARPHSRRRGAEDVGRESWDQRG
jgi:Photosynthetic reaction centre cytochrome C subunit